MSREAWAFIAATITILVLAWLNERRIAKLRRRR